MIVKYWAIKSCFECPLLEISQSIPYCGGHKPRKRVNYDLSIPEDCPLPDLKQDEM